MAKEKLAPHASDELLVAEQLILEMVDSGAALEDVLRAITAFVDRQNPAATCSIFVLDPAGGAVHAGEPAAGRCTSSDWTSPILSRAGAPLGLLTLHYSQPHVVGDDEAHVANVVSQWIGMCLERRAAMAQQRAGDRRYHALIENSSDVVSILDENGIIRYLSPSIKSVLGFAPAELMGRSAFDCFHPDDTARARQALQQALGQTSARLPIEQRLRHKDGSWRVLEMTASNRLTDPAIAGVVVTLHDVTARKDAEAVSQERYRELFENANDVVFTHDLNGSLTSLNRAGEILTGYSRAEALGMDIQTIVAPEHRQVAREMLERKLGGETKTTYELDLVAKDGGRLPVEVSTRLIFQMGKPVAVQGIARDIGERRRLESRLLQSHKMEAVGRLAGGVAHDFNNMLTVITGYSQWMLDDLEPGAALTESVSEILLAANRAAVLTNQLLAFSRSREIQPVVVDLNKLVAELNPMLRRMIGQGVELITAASPGLGLVRADPGQVEQVIFNLAVNARDALAGRGKLILEMANVEIEDHEQEAFEGPPGDYVMLAVTDSGCGIDEHLKAQIFEPFFTTKDKGKGTGLGLSTVERIVKQGGGHIRVESEPGTGATFRIYFPRVTAGVLPVVTLKPQRRNSGTGTVLLVEDEAAVRHVVSEMLLRLGYTVLEAPDPRSAQKLLMEYDKPVLLLLTDVMMPELGGLELARTLKIMRADLKVVFMSGYNDDAIAQQGLLDGDAAFLQKPFTPDALASKIRRVLDGG
jgi:two-component system cell cycle sensor histidine kinase/response regulator CckA